MSSPESSPSLFVQRLESSQVNLHYRLESSRVSAQTRIESPVSNSHESTTRPGVPKLALQTWRPFFGPHPISEENSSSADAKTTFFGLHPVSVRK